jgi:hypothetical protein
MHTCIPYTSATIRRTHRDPQPSGLRTHTVMVCFRIYIHIHTYIYLRTFRIPNFLDSDSDGDGIGDKDEGVTDVDGDGIPNFLGTLIVTLVCTYTYIRAYVYIHICSVALCNSTVTSLCMLESNYPTCMLTHKHHLRSGQ